MLSGFEMDEEGKQELYRYLLVLRVAPSDLFELFHLLFSVCGGTKKTESYDFLKIVC